MNYVKYLNSPRNSMKASFSSTISLHAPYPWTEIYLEVETFYGIIES